MDRRDFGKILGAAVAGMVAGTKIVGGGMDLFAREEKAKHVCKGMNSCKGQGGCKSGDKGCAGKNSCKGKGGCSVPIEAKKSGYLAGSRTMMA